MTPGHVLLLQLADQMSKRRLPPNPVSGLSDWLQHEGVNWAPNPPMGNTGPPIVIPGGPPPRRQRRGPLAY